MSLNIDYNVVDFFFTEKTKTKTKKNKKKKTKKQKKKKKKKNVGNKWTMEMQNLQFISYHSTYEEFCFKVC